VPWRPTGPSPLLAGCYVCFARRLPGHGGTKEEGWAAAVLMRDRRLLRSAVTARAASGPYEPGLLALREGLLLEAAVRALGESPELLIVHATGRDHPRGAGMAVHLGAVLDIPTIGVTERPLQATGAEPGAARGATGGLQVDGVEVARALRTRGGARPIVVHSGWRTDLDTATSIALASSGDFRTPEPLRCARRLAREARAAAECA
jgi:deoxyribonuclease V